MSSLADRLEAARRNRFVGRTAERKVFQSALIASDLPFYVLHLFGPGGVGKTTLLRELMVTATRMRVPTVYLDSRNVEPAPDSFTQALQRALQLSPSQTPFQFLLAQNKRFVIFIDTYEKLAPLDGWLRDDFLPQLPDNVLIVLAGRKPPTAGWRADPGWQVFMRALSLRNFSAAESRSFLRKRDIPAGRHAAVLDFTHGHPLALSLVADVFSQYPETGFQPGAAPDLIQSLLGRFLARVPSAVHRAALEVCALVRLTTESLLVEVLSAPNPTIGSIADDQPARVKASAHELFTWLRGLSFIESNRNGLFPHDLAREAITADLRWRDPDRYATLREYARTYYMLRVQQGNEPEQRRALMDYIFLHRSNPVVRPYFEWQESGSVFTDAMRPADKAAILAMVEAHEGPDSVRLADHWLGQQPQGANVFRSASGELKGFLQLVALEETTPADRKADPAVQTTWRHLQQQTPLRPGERATLFRFWMAQDTYQAVSPVQTRIFLNMVQHYLTTPGLAYTFIPCADPAFWQDIFAYADLARIRASGFTIGNRHYAVYGHDWRVVPPTAWLTLLGERETAIGPAPSPAATEPLVVLSKSDFATAVRDALRDFTNANALKNNPLLQSRLIVDYAGPDSTADERAAALRELLRETAASLQQSPRQTKFFQVLFQTYFQPAATQERAAERLSIPFGTYRRHLRAGITQVVERLWRQEIGD